MSLFYKANGKRKIYKKWLSLFIIGGILFAFIIFLLSWKLYNHINKDYREEGRINYLSKLNEGSATEKKNVVVILVDDMGMGDLSFTGSEAINTPNIDKLAQTGTYFSNYYSPNPICSASRAGLLTGRYPMHTLTCGAYMDTETIGGHFASWLQCVIGTYPYMNTGLPTDEILLPEVLQQVGYETGILGKWHLGAKDKEFPTKRGFDYFLGALYSDDMKPYRIYENENVLHSEPYDQTGMTKELTAAGKKFIKDNASKDKPFFLYYAQPFPHFPATCSPEWVGTSKAGDYGDCMQEVDWSVGEIVKTLEEEGILEDTLIMFTSDNGPWYEGATGGQRGRKATNYAGGSHVPCFVSMPGTIPGNRVENHLMSGLDLFPTILSMCGLNLPDDRVIDGIDMWKAWQGLETPKRERIFINETQKYYALIENNFVYLERAYSEVSHYWNLQCGPYLYNLDTDYEQAYDVSKLYPDVAEKMANEIKEYKASIKSNIRGWIDKK